MTDGLAIGRWHRGGELILAVLLSCMWFAAEAAALSAAAKRCERVVGRGLARCFYGVSRDLNACYATTGAPCAAAVFTRDLDQLQRRVLASCSTAALAELNYGPQLTVPALVERVRAACRGEAASLAARGFGGPHGAAWAAARQAYCGTRGRTGLRFFLPANPASLHGLSGSDSRFTTITSDGVTLRDWLAAAMSDPDNVADAVEEGTLTTSNPSIAPFPCTVD